jgi:hypothetical protein
MAGVCSKLTFWRLTISPSIWKERYDLGSRIFRYETKSVNLKNVSFKSWDRDFLNLAYTSLNNVWMMLLKLERYLSV